ncbi:hypothetical protein NBO_947g0002 [Nosema bombycis CQ1]|uniref:Uncharacterized protein n=1 Tax=Nosema bombycis (strain CQ1 / CVCC 102059) TaxID=578461 RepID=R0MC79_NOSB1|nr:hypothetical protein NBO_947g0002 [Nosema bombycis CQ1]|eukprot:EOB11660.1 hypothetical protein NBO_947g0002 [Nosema bombycis CQ1]
MYSLVLNFPFKINKIKTQHIYKTKIERKENLISFALNWRYPITIEGATCLSISNENDLFLYVFKLEDINKAIDFMENTSVDVQRILEFTDVEKLVDKTNKLMIKYEKNRKRI